MSHCPSEPLKESDVFLAQQMAEDLRAGSPRQAVNTGSWEGKTKANKQLPVFSERQDRRCGGQRGVQREAAWKTVSIHSPALPFSKPLHIPPSCLGKNQQGSPAGHKMICRKTLSVVAVIIELIKHH